MYYLVELLDIPCIIVTPLLVKMLDILYTNIRLDMMIGLMIFLKFLTPFDNHIQNTTHLDDICLAGAIRELCEARDSGVVQFADRNQMCNMTDMLCTR